jgi:predicted acetyltransferase
VLVDGFIAGFVLLERSELPGIDAMELADLFILKRYRRQGIGRAVAIELLTQPGDWLVRCHASDTGAVAFCNAVVSDLHRPVQRIFPGDDPQLLTYQITSVLH